MWVFYTISMETISGIKTFSQILREIVGYDPKGITHLSDSLHVNGIKIQKRNLYRYLNAERIPSLELAEEILKAENMNISTDQLKEVLKHSKSVSKENKENTVSNKFEKHIVIDLSSLSVGELSGRDVIDYIDDRVTNIYGNTSTKYSSYIKDLILEDVKNNILEENSDK